MKATLAFTVGLWVGALATTAAGFFYIQSWNRPSVSAVPLPQEQSEVRLQLAQQREARATAEAERLRQTVAELENRLSAQDGPLPPRAGNPSLRPVRRVPFATSNRGAEPAAWIVQSVLSRNPQVLPRLERAAVQNDVNALDAIALLADLDDAETLSRVWASSVLNAANRSRAAQLLAATAELNPHASDQLLAVTANGTSDDSLLMAKLAGLESPDFTTQLSNNPGIAPPPHFRPDYGLRLRILDDLRDVLTDRALMTAIDQTRERLIQRASENSTASQ